MLTIVSVFEDHKQNMYSAIGHLEFLNLSHIVDRPKPLTPQNFVRQEILCSNFVVIVNVGVRNLDVTKFGYRSR